MLSSDERGELDAAPAPPLNSFVFEQLRLKQNCVGPFSVLIKTNFSVLSNRRTHSLGRRAHFGDRSGDLCVTWKAVQCQGRCGSNIKSFRALEKPNTWLHYGFGGGSEGEMGLVWYS